MFILTPTSHHELPRDNCIVWEQARGQTGTDVARSEIGTSHIYTHLYEKPVV